VPEAAAAAQRQRIEPRQQPGGRLHGRDAGEAHHAGGHVQGRLAEAVAEVDAGIRGAREAWAWGAGVLR
jgi:hypothetical protein